MLLLLCLGLGACGQPAMLEQLSADSTCRATVHLGGASEPAAEEADSVASEQPADVEWLLPPTSADVRQLNAWCAAVGPAVLGHWSEPLGTPVSEEAGQGDGDTTAVAAPGPAIDSLLVVSWNVHIGGGELERLVGEIRSGEITGQPVEHFVLLLQEAYRGGEVIPPYDAGLPGGSGVKAAPPNRERKDIVRVAREHALDLFYAPSMRNGTDEDRGNAILSTLPLQEPFAVELPVARQRRVAVGGYIGGKSSSLSPRMLVMSVHLESDAAGLVDDDAARMAQAQALLESLDDEGPAVVAGDFNTRSYGTRSELVGRMLQAYPDTPPFPTGPTYVRAFGIYRLYLDYMFFRLPAGAEATYWRLPTPYNSDHYPLVGWVILDGV